MCTVSMLKFTIYINPAKHIARAGFGIFARNSPMLGLLELWLQCGTSVILVLE